MNRDGIDVQRLARMLETTAVAWELDAEAAGRCRERLLSGARVTDIFVAPRKRPRSLYETGQRNMSDPHRELRMHRVASEHAPDERGSPDGRKASSFSSRALALATIAALGSTGRSAMADSAGEPIFQSACIACHGADGAGALPGVPDLTAKDSPLALDDDVLLKRTIEGYQSPGSSMAMPPRAGNPDLRDEDLKAAIRYMRERFGKR